MAPMKRAASKAPAKKMIKKCKTIEQAVHGAESLPEGVRKIIGGRLAFVFGTYKEERHAFQNSVAALVGQALKTEEDSRAGAINEANQKKAAQEAEGATLKAAADQADAASEAAAGAAGDAKAALNNGSAALRDAKAALHNAETAVKTNETDASSTAAKKEKLEALIKEFFTPVKEGTLAKGLSKSAAWVGKNLGKEFASTLEKEFLTCVTRTFSKPSTAWGTFDHIIEKELDQELTKILAGLGSDITRLASEMGTRTAEVETAKAAVGAAEEAEKAAEEASKHANAAAKEAKAAAKAATASLKQQQGHIAKAGNVLEHAEHALKTFKDGAVAAFTEVEAHTAPPPPPAPVAEAAPQAAAVEAAMAPAPAQAASPRIGMSPAVQSILTSARNLLPSPRILSSPRTS